MRTLESFNVLESFGFESDVQGLFSEVSEVEMIDVIGGQRSLKPSFLLEKKYEKLFYTNYFIYFLMCLYFLQK